MSSCSWTKKSLRSSTACCLAVGSDGGGRPARSREGGFRFRDIALAELSF